MKSEMVSFQQLLSPSLSFCLISLRFSRNLNAEHKKPTKIISFFSENVEALSEAKQTEGTNVTRAV